MISVDDDDTAASLGAADQHGEDAVQHLGLVARLVELGVIVLVGGVGAELDGDRRADRLDPRQQLGGRHQLGALHRPAGGLLLADPGVGVATAQEATHGPSCLTYSTSPPSWMTAASRFVRVSTNAVTSSISSWPMRASTLSTGPGSNTDASRCSSKP